MFRSFLSIEELPRKEAKARIGRQNFISFGVLSKGS